MRIQKLLLTLVALVGTSALVGCNDSYGPLPGNGIKPVNTITVDQLASRLGLSSVKNAGTHYELTNANNRVLLFTSPNGRVWVNGTSICPTGTAAEVYGLTYVSELLVSKIRPHLVASPYRLPDTPDIGEKHSVSGTVVVDAGHGGSDPGATSYTGYYEKTVNLEIARKLASYLEDQGINVIMTRNNDTFVELNDRAAIANRANADIFVSIHCDSHPKRLQNGYTIYVAPSAKWATKKIGVAIEKSMRQTGLSSVGIRNRDFRVLMRTQCPAVLVECGYLTNPYEANLLAEDDFQETVARAIAEGITKSL